MNSNHETIDRTLIENIWSNVRTKRTAVSHICLHIIDCGQSHKCPSACFHAPTIKSVCLVRTVTARFLFSLFVFRFLLLLFPSVLLRPSVASRNLSTLTKQLLCKGIANNSREKSPGSMFLRFQLSVFIRRVTNDSEEDRRRESLKGKVLRKSFR